MRPTPDETLLHALQLLQATPQLSQRELSQQLGLSLGKAHYCLQALLAKGWVKAEAYRRSQNKLAYAYMLTPHGLANKAQLTRSFLQRKVAEYEQLQRDIERLRRDLNGHPPTPSA